jgi:glycosyltransferase involved in cell wall biosynthesis
MRKIKELSVFLPAYNEEENIAETISKTIKVLEECTETYELIIVDDGSKDKTGDVVNNLALLNNKIKLVSHEVNGGYGKALRTGFKSCKYEWIAFIDSDGQFNFEEFPNFINAQRETDADLVIGYYKERKVSLKRKISSKLWEFIVWILFGLKVRDIDCGFKLIRKEVIDSMNLDSERGAFISTELLVKAKSRGYKIEEIPVTHYERKCGKATGADLKVILNSFKDLYKLKKKFLLFCFVGFTSAFISLIIFNILLKLSLTFNQSIIIGTLSSAIYNFFMNRKLTFSATDIPVKKQIVKYAVIYSVAQGAQMLAGIITKNILGGGTVMSNIAVMVGIAISIPISFLGSLLWTFKRKGEEIGVFKLIEEKEKRKI